MSTGHWTHKTLYPRLHYPHCFHVTGSGAVSCNLCQYQNLLSILPTIDSLVLIDVKGSQIHQALENGVAAWPKLDAKFPQVRIIKVYLKMFQYRMI